MTSPNDFPEYSFQYHDNAYKARRKLDQTELAALDDIVNALARDPFSPADRIKNLGTMLRYEHPSPAMIVFYTIDLAAKLLRFYDFIPLKVPGRQVVFISYSHDDRDWLDRVRKQFEKDNDGELTATWDDTAIEA